MIGLANYRCRQHDRKKFRGFRSAVATVAVPIIISRRKLDSPPWVWEVGGVGEVGWVGGVGEVGWVGRLGGSGRSRRSGRSGSQAQRLARFAGTIPPVLRFPLL